MIHPFYNVYKLNIYLDQYLQKIYSIIPHNLLYHKLKIKMQPYLHLYDIILYIYYYGG